MDVVAIDMSFISDRSSQILLPPFSLSLKFHLGLTKRSRHSSPYEIDIPFASFLMHAAFLLRTANVDIAYVII
jgi:hypothetical protein